MGGISHSLCKNTSSFHLKNKMAVSHVICAALMLTCVSAQTTTVQSTVAATSPPATADCPEAWVPFENSCYYILNVPLDWFGAEKYCTMFDPTQYRVHLVSVESQREQEFLANVLRMF